MLRNAPMETDRKPSIRTQDFVDQAAQGWAGFLVGFHMLLLSKLGLHTNGYYSVHYVDFNKRLDGKYLKRLLADTG